MQKRTKFIVYGAMIAALYVTLTHAQNILLPDSATMAIQFRASEALCVLALFTPAAIPGLAVGCMVFNLTFIGALPFDWIVGSLASLLAAVGMWYTRKLTIKGYPLIAMLMPALTNAILVGAELTFAFGDPFAINALYVALGELGVLLILGTLLFYAIKARKLDTKLFG